LSAVISVATGYGASYAVASGGQLWVSGSNLYGAIGLPPPAGQTLYSRWAPVPAMSDVQLVVASDQHALALRSGGSVWATGQNSRGGESIIGFGRTTLQVPTWQPVPGLSDIVDISTGYAHSLALKSNGRIWATGDNANSSAQLSSFGWTSQAAFAEVPGISDVKAVVAGKSCSMAITGEGSLWVTGSSTYSALGLGLGAPYNVPTWQRVPNLSGVVAVNTDCDHSVAIKSDGTLWVAGANTYAALGMGQPETTFTAPRILSVWTQISGLTGF
jgi:alpha-tubulin suppressor-like RCC1 family protein